MVSVNTASSGLYAGVRKKQLERPKCLPSVTKQQGNSITWHHLRLLLLKDVVDHSRQYEV